MVDAVSRASVHSKTELVALYNFDNPQVENHLLKDLTGIAQPAVQCDFQIPRDRLYPPSADTGPPRIQNLLHLQRIGKSKEEVWP